MEVVYLQSPIIQLFINQKQMPMKKILGFFVLALTALMVALFYDTGPPKTQSDTLILPEIDLPYVAATPADPMDVLVFNYENVAPGILTGMYVFLEPGYAMVVQEPEVPLLEYRINSFWPVITNALSTYPLTRPIKQC